MRFVAPVDQYLPGRALHAPPRPFHHLIRRYFGSRLTCGNARG